MQVPRLNLGGGSLSQNGHSAGFQRLDSGRSSSTFSVPLSARRPTADTISVQHSSNAHYVQAKALMPAETATTSVAVNLRGVVSTTPRNYGGSMLPTSARSTPAAVAMLTRAPRGASSSASYTAARSAASSAPNQMTLLQQQQKQQQQRGAAVCTPRSSSSSSHPHLGNNSSATASTSCLAEELNAIDSLTVGDRFGALRLVDAVLLEQQPQHQSVPSSATTTTTTTTGDTGTSSNNKAPRSDSLASSAAPATIVAGAGAASIGMTRAEIVALKPTAIVNFTVASSDSMWGDSTPKGAAGSEDTPTSSSSSTPATAGFTVRVLSRHSNTPVTLVRFAVNEIRRLEWVSQHHALIVGTEAGASVTLRHSGSSMSASKLALLFKFLHVRCRGVFPSKSAMSSLSSSNHATVIDNGSGGGSSVLAPPRGEQQQPQQQQSPFPASIIMTVPLSARSDFSADGCGPPRPRSCSPPAASAPTLMPGSNAVRSTGAEAMTTTPAAAVALAPRAARKDQLMRELMLAEGKAAASTVSGVPADATAPAQAPAVAGAKRRNPSLPHVIVEEGYDPRDSRSSTPVQ